MRRVCVFDVGEFYADNKPITFGGVTIYDEHSPGHLVPCHLYRAVLRAVSAHQGSDNELKSLQSALVAAALATIDHQALADY